MVSPNNKSAVATRLAALFAFELRRLLGGRAFWALLLINPAIMKLWPEPSSTVVSARRTVKAGIWKPLNVTAP